jgi:hypothetical protein|nr:MAG TPA: YvrJ protein family protein [Caudoviricetes sp.]
MADTFLTILGNYVFPIVACCVMAYFVKYMYDQTNARVDKLNEQHKNEVDTLSEVIKNNTVALEKMNTLIERLEK